jgi:hypothetical protein
MKSGSYLSPNPRVKAMSDLAKLVIKRFPENRNMQLVG